jgi:ABC-type dipeptide/oligopeptide/nickel transport system ATPase component
MAEPLLLEVKDLNIEFHDHLIPETVVYDFDLELKAGEIVGLVGESGSGKSMSALAIAGLLSRRDMHKRGQILFDGLELLTCERSKLRKIQGNEISMIFQEPMTSLNPVKRIGWQIEESLQIHTELNKEERYQKAIEMMKEVELPDPERLYRQYPHELSGGMRQRVMIAAAMICNPRILIADEPTTALDVTIQAQIVELLKRMNREKQTSILFISHDLSLVKQLCERVLVMKGGYIVETGLTQEVFAHPKEEYTQRLIAAIPKVKRNGK